MCAQAAAAAAGAPSLGGVQQQELQIEAKLSFYALMKEAYDPEGQESKPAKQLAKAPAVRYVKQVCRHGLRHGFVLHPFTSAVRLQLSMIVGDGYVCLTQ
jgi:hypothetical protein